MKCPVCGKEVHNDAKFCYACGTDLTATPVAGGQTIPQPLNFNSNESQVVHFWNPPKENQVHEVYAYSPPSAPGEPQIAYIRTRTPGRGFGITCLVMGIIGLILAISAISTVEEYHNQVQNLQHLISQMWIPYAGAYSSEADALRVEIETVTETMLTALAVIGVVPLLSLIFGICATKREYKNVVSVFGIIFAVIALVVIVLESFSVGVQLL